MGAGFRTAEYYTCHENGAETMGIYVKAKHDKPVELSDFVIGTSAILSSSYEG